ncbi:hypothetical protein FACS1894126_6410 [Alphaproteobacteria bacterium]|nr:hypothetical protein FACS1894126_6410 [Alphaproteobacteria bacterium]
MFVRFRFLAKIRTFETTLSSMPSYRFIRFNPKTDTSMDQMKMEVGEHQKVFGELREKNHIEK